MTSDLQRRGLLASLAGRLPAASHDELRVIDRVLGRLELGRDRYGLLDLAKPRDWRRERFEERLDALVYDACEELAIEDQARAELREAARVEMVGGRIHYEHPGYQGTADLGPPDGVPLAGIPSRQYVVECAQVGAITPEVARGLLADLEAANQAAIENMAIEVDLALASADRRQRCVDEHGYGCGLAECGRADVDLGGEG
jgi:hypothetical protein